MRDHIPNHNLVVLLFSGVYGHTTQTNDPATRDQLVYTQLLIREATCYGVSPGWIMKGSLGSKLQQTQHCIGTHFCQALKHPQCLPRSPTRLYFARFVGVSTALLLNVCWHVCILPPLVPPPKYGLHLPITGLSQHLTSEQGHLPFSWHMLIPTCVCYMSITPHGQGLPLHRRRLNLQATARNVSSIIGSRNSTCLTPCV